MVQCLMRGASNILAFCFALLIVVGGAALFWGASTYRSPGPLQEKKDVLIPRGTGLSAMAGLLADNGVIAHPYVFMAAAKMTGKARLLKAGEYEFLPAVSMAKVIDKIARGDILVHKVTIPEGLTSWQIVQILDHTDGLSGAIADVPAEGSLLPQTYTFMRGDTKDSIIARMKSSMAKTLDDLWAARATPLPLMTKAEAVVLASIVEKETGVPDERPRIASVFLNRITKAMPLQSDPTVIYALTKGQIQENGQGPLGRHLLTADLAVDSPYNTYKYPGLPPGPIANPGAASLTAVLHPEQTDYLYFVASGTGGHVFARTLEEHNKNVAQWRQIRK